MTSAVQAQARPQALHGADKRSQNTQAEVWVTGSQEQGWLTWPAQAVQGGRPVRFELCLNPDQDGYVLSYRSEDGELSGDTWHRSEAEARSVAEQDFNVRSEAWRHV
ncbi:MAG: hypothetical protein U1E77_02635 [Inhella sp.]